MSIPRKFLPCGLVVLSLTPISVLGKTANGVEVPPKPSKPNPAPTLQRAGRDTLSLDGSDWRFSIDMDEVGESSGWTHTVSKRAKTATVPALESSIAPGFSSVAWYWRDFTVPTKWKGQTVRLRFGAVGETAQVWLNGEWVGEHTGGATPFTFNVTKALKIGDENRLAIRVDPHRMSGHKGIEPTGIWQSVTLIAHDEAYLADLFPQPDALGRVSIAVELLNTSQVSGDATLDAKIVAEAHPDRELKTTNQNLSLTPGRNITTVETGLKPKQIRRWSLDAPNLYRIAFAFRQGKDVLDTDAVTFGFRQFGIVEGAITFNGEPINLKAQSLAPASAFASPLLDDLTQARAVLRRAKEQGANVVWLSSPPPAFLRAGDEEGVLIVEGSRPGLSPEAALTEMQELIRRDRAHPCLLAWNLGDMSLAQTNTCRRLDPTRFFLVGSGANMSFWPTGESAMPTMQIPPGLRPAN